MDNFDLIESMKDELANALQDLQASDVDKVIGFIMGVMASKTLSQQNQSKESA